MLIYDICIIFMEIYICKNKRIKHNLRFNVYNKNGGGGGGYPGGEYPRGGGGGMSGGKCPETVTFIITIYGYNLVYVSCENPTCHQCH